MLDSQEFHVLSVLAAEFSSGEWSSSKLCEVKKYCNILFWSSLYLIMVPYALAECVCAVLHGGIRCCLLKYRHRNTGGCWWDAWHGNFYNLLEVHPLHIFSLPIYGLDTCFPFSKHTHLVHCQSVFASSGTYYSKGTTDVLLVIIYKKNDCIPLAMPLLWLLYVLLVTI